MFACRRKMSYQQIIDEFDDYLDDKQRDFLNTYYAKHSPANTKDLVFSTYESYFPDVCQKTAPVLPPLHRQSLFQHPDYPVLSLSVPQSAAPDA